MFLFRSSRQIGSDIPGEQMLIAGMPKPRTPPVSGLGPPLATRPDAGILRRRRARLANQRLRMSDSTG